MFEIQKTNRIHDICGIDNCGRVEIVPEIKCVRKYMSPKHSEWDEFKSSDQKKMFAFVSSPKMPNQQDSLFCEVNSWCHPFRKPSQYLKKSESRYIMMPESDFMDIQFVKKNDEKPIYDFFYFTVNSKQGVDYKGLQTFIDMLPVLCGQIKKRGLVIVYYPSVGTTKKFQCLNNIYKKKLKIYEKYLKFIWGWQNSDKMASIMSLCKFGIFPNCIDCSPRIISECILRDRPILVNKYIYGGWHYVNENTGCFFMPGDKNSVLSSVQKVGTMQSSGRDFFMKNYGFKRSAMRLRDFLLKDFPVLEKYEGVYFSCYRSIMKQIWDAS